MVVTSEHFTLGLARVRPSSLRGIAPEVSTGCWLGQFRLLVSGLRRLSGLITEEHIFALLPTDTYNMYLVLTGLSVAPKVPTATWDDVGGLRPVKRALRELIELPLRRPELLAKFRMPAAKGALLYGPPGEQRV